MEISRKTFLRRVALGAVGATAGAPLLGAFSAFGQGAATAPAAGQPQPEIIDGEKVMRAVPVTKAEANEGGARFVNSGPGFGRRVAFTFDDGPHPKNTPVVLNLLKERGIYATFFMIGGNVALHPEIAKMVSDAGHEVGNHSMTHPQLSRLPEEKVVWEIQRTQDLITAAIGHAPVWFRPPYGAFRHDQGYIAAARGLGVMFWSVDPRDWAEPGVQKVTDAIFAQTRPGSVILTHDIHKPTVEALPGILDGLLERGYEFTTVSGFLGAPYGGLPGTVPPGVTPASGPAAPNAPGTPAPAIPTAPAVPVAPASSPA